MTFNKPKNIKDILTGVIMIVLCISLIAVYQQKNTAEQEAYELKNKSESAWKIETVETKRNEVKKREKDVYPQLERTLRELEDTRKQLKAAEAKLKTPNRGDITNEIKPLTENEVSRMLTDLGYPATVRECK